MNILNQIAALVNSMPKGVRDPWEQYFMSMAYVSSLRSTCGSRRVGAVLVDSLEPGFRRIIATGYNNYPAGAPHCIDGGCPRFEARKKGILKSGEYAKEFYCDAFHAEENALNQIKITNVSAKGSIMFTTTHPCISCAEKIKRAQIQKVYYCEGYPDNQSQQYLAKYGIDVIRVEKSGFLQQVVELVNSIPLGFRDSWKEYFMGLAFMAASRSEVKDRREGAVLVNNMDKKRVIATGYNGYTPGWTKEEDQVTGAILNAIYQVVTSTVSAENAILFSTHCPDLLALQEINGAAIKQVYYKEGTPNLEVANYASRYNIILAKL